jgi:hypothetical protein
LRKRSQLMQQRTANLLNIQNLLTRNTGSSIGANGIKASMSKMSMNSCPTAILAVKANLSVMCSADEQTQILERAVDCGMVRPISTLRPWAIESAPTIKKKSSVPYAAAQTMPRQPQRAEFLRRLRTVSQGLPIAAQFGMLRSGSACNSSR